MRAWESWGYEAAGIDPCRRPAGGGQDSVCRDGARSFRCKHDHGCALPARRFAERASRRSPQTDPELRRYRAAGACAAAQYSFPGGDDAQDAFFMAGFMEDYSEAVLLEGDNPVGFVDVTVYVAQASGGRLLVRGKRDRTGKEQAGVDALDAVLRQPGGLDLLLERLVGGRVSEVALRHSELVERERLEALAQLDRLRRRPEPRSSVRWAIADSYRGIEGAQLVVVNIRGEAERGQGDVLLDEVARLRKDQAVFDDVMGRRGQ